MVRVGRIERIGLADAVLWASKVGDRPQPRQVRRRAMKPASRFSWILSPSNWPAVRFVPWVIAWCTAGRGCTRRTHHAEVLAELRRIIQLAPEHLPAEITLIEAPAKRLGDVPQIACFDTAFHHAMPRWRKLLPLPRRFDAAGIRRYGFHGLSYTYLLEELRRLAPPEASGRVIFAHLGNGASMAAVHDGQCVDTSMAFTPAAGLVMSTRTGDLDPGLAWHLLHNEHLSVDEFYLMVNRQSGLLGVSEISSDMRDLLSREEHDVRAAEAIALFCYQARKWIGAYAAALTGLDTLVFSAGIGENAAEVRRRICDGLQFPA